MWKDQSGIDRVIFPHITDHEETYAINAFHQMHCLLETLRDYGFLINGYRPQHEDDHVIHCFNMMFKAISCLADPTAEGYLQQQPSSGGIIGNITSEVATRPLCRDFQQLRLWADDPIRAASVPYGLVNFTKAKLPDKCDVRNCRDESGWMEI
ncbi:hypothetical protein COCVIDRAFT_21381 [Bipolaris victoriae FI3]|uniref:Uncharacterized protein n=1 Tax=Bipolaris victoriae (strain FI3) TaxID=930091 RepID=W7DQA5_BIPV3|nr:hypothetical protein COCVIDRAFT_21381 [Bipolaris victoriae FI3]